MAIAIMKFDPKRLVDMKKRKQDLANESIAKRSKDAVGWKLTALAT